jgi:DNA-3-methyladenine glycosylase II
MVTRSPPQGHQIPVMRAHLAVTDDGFMDRDSVIVGPRREDGGVPNGKGADSVTEDSSRAAWLQQARSYLRDADPVLARLIDDRPDFDPRAWMTQLPPMDLYGALLFQITGQQLSVPATRRTLARIQDLFGGHLPTPAELLAVEPDKLREAGLSWRKIGTLRDLAERLTDGRLDQDVLSSLPDDELMAELTAISGIGPWTVQGALLVALQREDVVLPGDLALRKAVQAAYQLDHLPSQDEVLAIAEKWRPYRSLATSYLFSSAFEPAEATPVAPRET